MDERENAKKLDKENLDVESTKGKAMHGPRVLIVNLQGKSLRALKMRVAESKGRRNEIINEVKSLYFRKQRLQPQGQARGRRRARRKRLSKEEEMEREEEALWDKGKTENTEFVGSSEKKPEKEEEVAEIA